MGDSMRRVLEILNNNLFVKIVYPIAFAVLSYITDYNPNKFSFHIYILYFLFYNFIGFFIGYIIISIITRLGQKERLSNFISKMNSFIKIFIFYIALTRIEMYMGVEFQTIFIGAILWIDLEIS